VKAKAEKKTFSLELRGMIFSVTAKTDPRFSAGSADILRNPKN
jgi:hypothetical protein